MNGRILKNAIARKRIPQKELADRIGMDVLELQAAFTSDNVSTGLVESLAVALGVGMKYFYEEKWDINLDESEITNTNIGTINARNAVGGDMTLTEHIGQQDNSIVTELLRQNATLIEIIKAKL